jgi:hypothetical protein
MEKKKKEGGEEGLGKLKGEMLMRMQMKRMITVMRTGAIMKVRRKRETRHGVQIRNPIMILFILSRSFLTRCMK